MELVQLFKEGKIGPLTLKNRGVMMPMATDMADRYGLPTPRQIAYYKERAKGGIAMIVNEYTGVDDVDSIPSIHNLRAAEDYHISALEELTDAVHLYDCLIFAQLHHGGATSNPAFTGRQNLAPSAVPIADGRPVPKEMTLEDIRRVQGKFIDAAVRCKKAGYDGVELHGAHGYLIAQFFSKYYNRRTDEYGGSVENRCRFIAEIIRGIRAKLGSYPLTVRMCGDEFTDVPGFLTLEDGIEIAKYLEQLGIDAISISAGSARNGDANCEPFSYRFGWKKHVAKAYKEALHIPVIATGTVKGPDEAEQLLEEGVCDFVGLGRSQLADPAFMKKAAEGRTKEIRKCIGCLYCRERVLGNGLPIRCALNPRTGREIDFPDLPSDGAGRTVAVIGSGPAGMQAAITLSDRGFRPVIFERDQKAGGTLNLADKASYKERITRFTETLIRELAVRGIVVNCGVKEGREEVRAVKALRPSAVIVACGAEQIIPKVPGVDGPQVCTAEEVRARKAIPVGRVAVVGSGLTGLETAEKLLSLGRHEVSIVEQMPVIGPGIFPAILNDELKRVKEAKLYAGYRVTEIKPGSLRLEKTDGTAGDGSDDVISVPADTVVLAAGVRPRKEVVDAVREAFAGTGVPVIAVGDARKSGRIASAVREGYEAAVTLKV